MWTVYHCSFVTQSGVKRHYYGMTEKLSFVRERELSTRSGAQPVWLGEDGCFDFKFEVLRNDFQSRYAALAAEALVAARGWAKAPQESRGGPWCRRKLPDCQIACACASRHGDAMICFGTYH